MHSTMQDGPLLISQILRRGARVFADTEVVTYGEAGSRRATFAEVGANAGRLANGLRKLHMGGGDRIGTLMWNNQEHLEAYLAVPSMGAVLHTLNLRLPPQQLAFVINHAEDKAIIVDSSLLPLLAAIEPLLTTVKHYIVCGDGDASALPGAVRYADFIARESPDYNWPLLDERHPASMCYTTGTTGDPKGVVYSHRSVCCTQWPCGARVFSLNRTACSRSCQCFTSTRGALRLPPSWSVLQWSCRTVSCSLSHWPQ